MKRIAYILTFLCATAFAQSDEDFELEKEKLALEIEKLALEREKLTLEAKKAEIESSRTTKKRKSHTPYGYNKGELYLHISHMLFNSAILELDEEGRKIGTYFFFGFSSGFDFHHSHNQFMSLRTSVVVLNLGGEWEADLLHISFSNNHRINKFSIGYGVSYAGNFFYKDWEYIDEIDDYDYTSHKSYGTFGLIFPAYFYSGEIFSVGIVYRPTFFRPHMRDKFKYEHLISLDLAFKIRLVKR
jgi:hypothetical protein